MCSEPKKLVAQCPECGHEIRVLHHDHTKGIFDPNRYRIMAHFEDGTYASWDDDDKKRCSGSETAPTETYDS